MELIASDLNSNHITFELEHDSEIIADNLKIKGTSSLSAEDLVQEVMRYIISLDLFTEDGGHIFCFKLLKRLDSSMTSNPKMRKMITDAKNHHDTVMIPSCKKRIEEIRIEEIRIEEKKRYGIADNVFLTDGEHAKLTEKLKAKRDEYIDNLSTYEKVDTYKSHYRTILKWWNKDGKPTEKKLKVVGGSDYDDIWKGVK